MEFGKICLRYGGGAGGAWAGGGGLGATKRYCTNDLT